MKSEIQERVQKTIRDMNNNFCGVRSKLTYKQLTKFIEARALIKSILDD